MEKLNHSPPKNPFFSSNKVKEGRFFSWENSFFFVVVINPDCFLRLFIHLNKEKKGVQDFPLFSHDI